MTALLTPLDWPAPAPVQAGYTTKYGGVSQAPYVGLNLGDHVGDDPQDVLENRVRLQKELPSAPRWVKQEHGTRVMEWAAQPLHTTVIADGAFTAVRNVVCVMLTADCLPIFLCGVNKPVVAVVHAGWRGLASGVLEATLQRMSARAGQGPWMAYLGPAIGPAAFEVGPDVRQRFVAANAQDAHYFHPHGANKWMADLPGLARARLERLEVKVFGGTECTFTDEQRFYSHRRATTRGQSATGRMASLIWLND